MRAKECTIEHITRSVGWVPKCTKYCLAVWKFLYSKSKPKSTTERLSKPSCETDES